MHSVRFNMESLKGRRLGGGCFSQVYELNGSDEWVIKVGNNDGTRTYLEWVKRKQDAGQSMRGMPRVDWIVSAGPDTYVACIERLPVDPGQSKTWKSYGLTQDYPSHGMVADPGLPEYVHKLINAMRAECNIRGCDMHCQNFMVNRQGDIVLTDPDSMGYIASPWVESTAEGSQLELFHSQLG